MVENQEYYRTAAFLGDMYGRWTLDCLVEIAHAIAIDYFYSPEFYLGDDTPEKIVDLWLSYGSVKNFPNKDQRYILAGAIFGECDGYASTGMAMTAMPGMTATPGMTAMPGMTAEKHAFHANREPLFQTSILAQTATSAQSIEGLNTTVLLAALPEIRSYLGYFPGKAARIAYEQIKAVSDVSYEILRSPTVSSRFTGIHCHILDQWPLQGPDPNGDKLIAECVRQLKVDVQVPKDFPHLRTLAQVGKEAIEAILNPDAPLDDIIQKVYTWAMFTGKYPPYTGNAPYTGKP